MKTYNTLQEVYNDTRPHQVTAQELLNGRTHVNGNWGEITISSELRKEICQTLSEMYGGRQVTKHRVYNNLLSEHRQHWGLGRTVIEDYGNGAHLIYITGQDQSWENKAIRNDLK